MIYLKVEGTTPPSPPPPQPPPSTIHVCTMYVIAYPHNDPHTVRRHTGKEFPFCQPPSTVTRDRCPGVAPCSGYNSLCMAPRIACKIYSSCKPNQVSFVCLFVFFMQGFY